MTIHVAASLADATASVIFSDSQASTLTDEFHGAQKLYAGEDYLVGCAGSVAIIHRLFELMDEDANLDASGITGFIEQFIANEISPESRGMLDALTITPSGGLGPAIQRFSPSIFTHFGSRSQFNSIGSGAEFVIRAMNRDAKNGIPHPLNSMVDLFVATENLAEAANESLTVDDLHLVGILRNGRTYLLGHRDVTPRFVAPALVHAGGWAAVSHSFEQVLAIVDTIKSEISTSQHTASLIRSGALQPHDVQTLINSNQAIAHSRAALELQIDSYCAWYDIQLAR